MGSLGIGGLPKFGRDVPCMSYICTSPVDTGLPTLYFFIYILSFPNCITPFLKPTTSLSIPLVSLPPIFVSFSFYLLPSPPLLWGQMRHLLSPSPPSLLPVVSLVQLQAAALSLPSFLTSHCQSQNQAQNI